MVKPESYKFNSTGPKPSAPKGVNRYSTQTLIAKLVRTANGSWFATADVTLTFELADGRTVTTAKQVRIRGSQNGSLPNPDPFGWKRKKHGAKREKK